MKAITRVLALCLAALPVAASAVWATNSDDGIGNDDFLTSGMKATIVAPINDYDMDQTFIFDCTNDKLYFTYAENTKDWIVTPVEMTVKVDSGDVIKMKGETGPMGENYSKASSSDREAIISILKAVKKSKSEITVGLNFSDLDIEQSFVSAGVTGSKKAVTDFAKACEIKLDD